MASRISRRMFVRLLGLTSTGLMVAACSSAAPAQPTTAPKAAAPAAPTSAPAAAAPAAPKAAAKDPMAEWDALVQAAKGEGKVVVNTFPGSGYRATMTAFEEKFPGITVEHTTLIVRELATRVVQEQKAGIYGFDVAAIPATTALEVMLPAGAWDPIRPIIFHPEVVGDQYWKGGFERGFLDNSKQYGFGFGWNKSQAVWVNTDEVKPGEITTAKDLLNPKWKGKMVFMDPRSGGFTANPMTLARIAHGDAYLKSLFIDQEPVFTRDQRQNTEMIIRGGYAVATGPTSILLDDFRAAGVTVNVQPLALSDATSLGGWSAWLFKNAPHPNAAKLFTNWLLTKEGQQVFNEFGLQQNSRRSDIAPIDPATYPTAEEEKQLVWLDSEEMVAEVAKTQKIATELLK